MGLEEKSEKRTVVRVSQGSVLASKQVGLVGSVVNVGELIEAKGEGFLKCRVQLQHATKIVAHCLVLLAVLQLLVGSLSRTSYVLPLLPAY